MGDPYVSYSQNTDFILIEAAIVDTLCSDLIRKSRPTASTSRSTGPDPTLTTWSFFRSRSTTRDTIINMFFSTPASLLNLNSNSNPNPNPNPVSGPERGGSGLGEVSFSGLHP